MLWHESANDFAQNYLNCDTYSSSKHSGSSASKGHLESFRCPQTVAVGGSSGGDVIKQPGGVGVTRGSVAVSWRSQ